MLVGAADTSVETFDTTAIHAETAADFAIATGAALWDIIAADHTR